MIVTDQFVMLNFPKTGSSFAREVLKRLYGKRRSCLRKIAERLHLAPPTPLDLILPKIDEEIAYGASGQHGTKRQIPEEYRDRPVMTIARNPFTRYVSLYRFRWWARFPPGRVEEIQAAYPGFPDLSFPDYYAMNHRFGGKNRLRDIVPKVELGVHTIQFIQFYFRNPEEVLRNIDEAWIEEERYRDELQHITFLHQENLNEELKAFLLGVGIPAAELEFMDLMEHINVTGGDESERHADYYEGNDIRDRILRHERLLFKIFPMYLPEEPHSA